MSRPISHQPLSPEEVDEMRAQVAAPEEYRGGMNGHALNLMGRFLATHDPLSERVAFLEERNEELRRQSWRWMLRWSVMGSRSRDDRVRDLFARIVKSIEYYADDGMLLRLLEEYHGLEEELRG